MINNRAAYKYEIPYKVSFSIERCFTNGTVNLHCGPKKLGIINIGLSQINLIQTLKILTQKICMTKSTYDRQLYTFVLY